MDGRIRCRWVDRQPEVMIRYHDEEWGAPVHDDRLLFELLCLGGMQAGLNWLVVLQKREALKKRFLDFDIRRCARLSNRQIEAALGDASIIRNRLKVQAVKKNAVAALTVIQELGSLDTYFWSFVGGVPVINHHRSLADLPATTPLSDTLSRDLKKRGFTFAGSTICYAFMQAAGMVLDHEVRCFRHRELAGLPGTGGAAPGSR